MSNNHATFPMVTSETSTEDDVEQMLWKGTFSAKSMIGGWIGAAFVTLLILLAAFQIDTLRQTRMVGYAVASFIALLWLGLLGLAVYRKMAQHYEITSQRLMHRDGILIRKMDRIELIDIDDVSYQQGPVQTLLNVGTVNIVSSDSSHPNLTMRGIANVRHVADLIDNARRTERRKRGIHIESI